MLTSLLLLLDFLIHAFSFTKKYYEITVFVLV